MTELANKYYFEHNFYQDENIYNRILLTGNQSSEMKYRLIVCNTQTGKPDKALGAFIDLVAETKYISLNQADKDHISEILAILNDSQRQFTHPLEYYTISGILDFFNNRQNSLAAFKRAIEINPSDRKLKFCAEILSRSQ